MYKFLLFLAPLLLVSGAWANNISDKTKKELTILQLQEKHSNFIEAIGCTDSDLENGSFKTGFPWENLNPVVASFNSGRAGMLAKGDQDFETIELTFQCQQGIFRLGCRLASSENKEKQKSEYRLKFFQCRIESALELGSVSWE